MRPWVSIYPCLNEMGLQTLIDQQLLAETHHQEFKREIPTREGCE